MFTELNTAFTVKLLKKHKFSLFSSTIPTGILYLESYLTLFTSAPFCIFPVWMGETRSSKSLSIHSIFSRLFFLPFSSWIHLHSLAQDRNFHIFQALLQLNLFSLQTRLFVKGVSSRGETPVLWQKTECEHMLRC